MRKINWFWLLTLTASVAFADEWHKTFPVSGKPDLRIEVSDGSVSIRSSERNEIAARGPRMAGKLETLKSASPSIRTGTVWKSMCALRE